MFAAFLVEIQIQAQSTAATDEKRAGEDHQQQHLHGPCVQIAFFQLRFPSIMCTFNTQQSSYFHRITVVESECRNRDYA